jgi:hypothetical protein
MRHTASVEVARMPRTCGQCHLGPDHSQIGIYAESKHGVLLAPQTKQQGDPGPAKDRQDNHERNQRQHNAVAQAWYFLAVAALFLVQTLLGGATAWTWPAVQVSVSACGS